MLLAIVLLLFLSERTAVESMNTSMDFINITVTTMPTEGEMPPLKVVATPDHPVAAGQRVHLLCSTPTVTAFVTWSWWHLQNQTWKEVGSSRETLLTEPKQSGVYRCYATNQFSQTSKSPNHTVYIVSVQATVGEKLGIAGFVLSLLVLISIIFGLTWMGCKKLGGTLAASSSAVKGVSGPDVASKGGLPQADIDGDVYINYTGTNQAYTDLDPSNITGENVYSSLS